MIWGLFPTSEPISWEGHLSGFLAGAVVAFFYRKQGPERKKYQWEIDEELESAQTKKETNFFYYTIKEKNGRN